jgi:dCMP deaminase
MMNNDQLNDCKIDYMKLAAKASELSDCRRKKVGVTIQRADGNGTITGWNHLPAGVNQEFCISCPREGKAHGHWNYGGECPVVHSERDIIYKAARHGVSLQGAIMYCTYKPCLPCAIAVVEAGIVKVVYRDDYPGGQDMEDYLKRCGVELIRWEGGAPNV